MTAAPASLRRVPGAGAITAAYQLGLSTVLTRGRLIASAALVAIVLIQFSAIAPDDLEGGFPITFVFLTVVIGLLVPIYVVSTASNVFGAAVTDSTLVYPWLRPARRWQLAIGHIDAALTLNLPVALLCAGGGAAVVVKGFEGYRAGGGGKLILFACLTAGLTALAYTPIVTALGVRFKRASTFAFVYIFLWEQLFARNNTGMSRLAIQTYIRSIYFSLSKEEFAGRRLEIGTVVSPGVAWVTLGLIVVAGTALTAFLLKRSDVA